MASEDSKELMILLLYFIIAKTHEGLHMSAAVYISIFHFLHNLCVSSLLYIIPRVPFCHSIKYEVRSWSLSQR